MADGMHKDNAPAPAPSSSARPSPAHPAPAHPGAVRLGRCVAVLGAPALLALTLGWLFLGVGTLRTAVVWTALATLSACLFALAGYVLATGRVTARRAYELALDAVAAPAAGVPAAPVPATLHGSRWTWARIIATAVAVPATVVLLLALGTAEPDRGATAGRIAGAGYVIKELPVVAVGNVERAGSSPRASSQADYTVRLPSRDGGRGVPATFRAEVDKGVADVGETFFVGYPPDRPRLGAVGAGDRSTVEAQLAGRTQPGGVFLFVFVWALLGVPALLMGAAVAPPFRERRVDGGWVALRATVAGTAEHVEPRSNAPKREGAAPARYPCLTLRTEAGDVPLHLTAASHKCAAPLLVGTEGWLLWRRTVANGKSSADFVADDGWQLPGRVPGAEAVRVADRPRGKAPIDAGRRVRLLGLGSLWPRTVPVRILLGTVLTAAAMAALLLPADGGWRPWTALAGALAPLVAAVFVRD
ncbi:hypothetical protein [Streptomyces sp. NPDC101150]|uniref:hypothetical protein n=1 Tax=Streptomyces sp. NPDC101150 TaxID=3366114 RepID=UPI003816CC75